MHKARTIGLFFFVFAVAAICASGAFGCTCLGQRTGAGKNFQPCGVFWRADVVFIGTAQKISLGKASEGGSKIYTRMVVHFSVDKPIRGVSEKTIEVETSPSTASCGYPFREGVRYFLYLRRDQNGRLTEGLCGATVPLDAAQPDLDYLKAVESGEQGGRVFGNVRGYVQASYHVMPSYDGLAGITVRLESVKVENSSDRESPKYVKRKFETRTSEDGFYLFMNIPEGLYTVDVDLPPGLRRVQRSPVELRHYVQLDAEGRRCGSSDFVATSLSSVEGRVLNRDGSVPQQQGIYVIPIDVDGRPRTTAYPQPVWISPKDGKYRFDTVAPGTYTLAVNPQNCHSREAPQNGRTFYPGVASESETKSFTVRENVPTELGDFRLLPPLREKTISGIVLSADNSPVSGARVLLLNSSKNGCSSGSAQVEAKTDASGAFEIKGFETYEYTLRAYLETRSGQSRYMASDIIEIPASAENNGNIRLMLKNAY